MYRPVRIIALGFRNVPEERIWETVCAEADYRPDFVVLPEAWLGDEYPRSLTATVLHNAAETAARLNAYILCPLYRDMENGVCRNSAFLLDRRGTVIHTFDKIFPWWKEFRGTPPCEPGAVSAVDTDCGRISAAICFDVNFPAIWEAMERSGAELVLWPSDYSAGTALQAHAVTHHYPIVSATRLPDSAVYDISGAEMRRVTGGEIVINKTVLDLDRRIFHENFNLEKREKLLAAYPDIIIEAEFKREQWFILSSQSDRVSVEKAALEFEMEDLRSYLRRSGATINGRALERAP
jgi:predicted amidohydrolase